MKSSEKYGHVAQALDDLLRNGRWRVGQRLPGERLLATHFGVSYLTLRRAMESLIQRGILERRHGSGTYVVGNNAIHNVGVLLGPPSAEHAARPFVGLLLDQLKARFIEHGLHLRSYLCFGTGRFSSEPCYAALRQDVAKGAVKALIMEPVMHKTEIETLHASLCPVVIMSASDYRVHAVFLDFAALARDGVMALATKGCKRIAYLDPYAPETRPENRGRRLLSDGAQGFATGLRQAGLREVCPALPLGEACLPATWECLRQIRFDGLVIGDDVWGKRLLDQLLLDGRRPGRDFQAAILANRGATVLQPYDPLLIKLEVDPAEIARRLLDLAMQAATPAGAKTCLRQAVQATVLSV